MRVVKKALGIFALVMACMPGRSAAQYVHEVDPLSFSLKNQMRYEFGGGLTIPFGEFNGVARTLYPSGAYRGDTTIARPLMGKPGTGFNFSIGLSMPFKGTGHISCWAMKIEMILNHYMWQDLNQTYKDGSFSLSSVSINATTQSIMLPLGVEYKVGNDAILSKRLYFGAAFGGGLIPQYNRTILEGVSTVNPGEGWGLTPYAKVELDAFTGLCWKLRFMYTVGDVNLIDVPRRITTLTDGPISIKSKSNFIAGLIIMPWSYQWQETDWWNTYDTYNQHDRFN